MRRYIRFISVIFAFFVFFLGSLNRAGEASTGATGVIKQESTGYMENVSFSQLKGKERIVFTVSKQPSVNVENSPANGVVIKMSGMFVPEEFRKSLGEGKFTNIIRAVPAQSTLDGIQWAVVRVDLKERVPYSVTQQGSDIIIDFNVASIESKAAAVTPKDSVPAAAAAATPPGKAAEKAPEGPRRQTERRISLDFQDANIKAVLRLLAEEGGVTIVSGEDVKGNVTVHMKRVPWEQALDTILGITGLVKKQTDDVISVMTLDRMKREEADRRQGEKDRAEAEAMARKMEQERLVERGKLAQVSIEAKIVEATDEFVRNLGVRWGGVGYGTASSTGWALVGGTNTDRSRGMTWGYPEQVPFRTTDGKVIQSMAVNYPSALAAPALGLIIGGASAVLEAQLSALETKGQGKIISSPKITTMDNVKATIKQGEEIPYITIDRDGNRSISFKEAVLKLDVKPKITPDGRISMEIKATNDFADYAKAEKLGGNPPINKSEVESKIVVNDGDTIAIGGVQKTEDYKDVSGVPWLSQIPVLGWLFKAEAMTKRKRELLIFITPKIMKDAAPSEKTEQTKG